MTPDAATLHVYLFQTTNDAMWAEDTVLEKGIPAEVSQAPPEAKSKCGLALRTRPEHARAVEEALSEVGIEFRRYHP